MDGYELHYYATFLRGPQEVSKYVFMSSESFVRLSRTSFVVCFLNLLATSCYARRTLGRSSETWLSRGRYSRRDASSSSQSKGKVSKVQRSRGLKPIAQGSKNTLNCVEQEWVRKYMQLSAYTKGRVSVELHRTRRNLMSKRKYVSDTKESDRRQGCPW